MPRNYKRKTETKYKLEDLKKAVQDVKNKKLSLGKAAIAYAVPKSTIHDYLNKDIVKMPKTGKKAIFTEGQEKELEDHILKCSKLFYGLTIEMVRKIAFKFAEVNKLKHNFDQNTAMAGKDWYYGFIKRHPNISLRKPEATSINRITAFNQKEVKIFFNNLEALQKKHNFNANRIYNIDETGISNVQRNSKILAPKGQKQVGMATSDERGVTTTVVCAMSASGKYVPPFFIFKRKRMNALLLRGGNADMVATVSDSGWINENLFIDWLHHFISFAKPTVEEPILLVLDNHESHVSLACYLLCRQNGIVLLSLPPHTSHRMQPLDLTYFGPLKTAYNKECDLYMAVTGRKITQYEVVEIFTKAFIRISNIEKAVNGFKAAGIWPLDTTKFDEMFSDLNPPDIQIASTSNLQGTVTSNALIAPSPSIQNTMTPAQITSSSFTQRAVTTDAPKSPMVPLQTAVPVDIHIDQTTPVQRTTTPDDNMELSPSILLPVTPETQIVSTEPYMHEIVTADDQLASSSSRLRGVTPEAQIILRKSVTPSASPTFRTSTPLQNIVSIPQLQQSKNMRKSRKKHSIIITSTPMKDALEEKDEKRKKKAEQKENIKTENKNKKKKKKEVDRDNKTDCTNKRKIYVRNLKDFEEDLVSHKKKKSTDQSLEDEEEYYCLICNEKYETPIIEDWIICYNCKRWAHENCTSGESTSKGFLCDFCAN